MNRDEQEMALWREAYMLSWSQDPDPADASSCADAAVAEFRKRYPPQTVAPPAVWYDEPPFAKDERHHWCWVTGESQVQSVYWSIAAGGWRYCQPHVRYCQPHVSGPYPLHNRRVCPIAKLPEPTT